MANVTKIELSAEELQVVTDKHWILTKQSVVAKLYELFNQQVPVIRQQFNLLNGKCPAELDYALPKISRGENYNGFPYVMLDYPALFKKDEIFALRTMFWWGNFMSITLLLSGGYKETFATVIEENCLRSPEGLYICVGDDPWEHHFERSNYLKVDGLKKIEIDTIIAEKDFLKLAIKIDIALINQTSLLQEGYAQMGKLFL